MYRTDADCVGLSVEDSQAPDVTVDGGPADYGEIYLSWSSAGEWLKYTVEVLESGTYGISMSDAGPAVTVLFSFSAVPAVTTGNFTVPQSRRPTKLQPAELPRLAKRQQHREDRPASRRLRHAILDGVHRRQLRQLHVHQDVREHAVVRRFAHGATEDSLGDLPEPDWLAHKFC